ETTAPDETTAPEEDTTSSTNFTVSGTPVGSVDDPPGDAAGCAGGGPTQSPLDITDVQVILGSTLSVGVTVSQPAEQFFAAGSNWWSAYLRADLKGTLPNGSPWAAAFLADQYRGTAMLGLVDPATGDVIPNGVSFVGNQIWFQHAFDPMPTITQVDLSTAAGETEQSPAACDQATVIGE
ncbi:MAG: hypothetical protein JW785_00785, partial [Acidimicrobiia bacterium]|nr:hypothetical protein [Acidimicrobiia bacterium]